VDHGLALLALGRCARALVSAPDKGIRFPLTLALSLQERGDLKLHLAPMA
jgi:hypothetical protein